MSNGGGRHVARAVSRTGARELSRLTKPLGASIVGSEKLGSGKAVRKGSGLVRRQRLVATGKWLLCIVVGVATGLYLGASGTAAYYQYAAPHLASLARAGASTPTPTPSATASELLAAEWRSAKRAKRIVAPGFAGGTVYTLADAPTTYPPAAQLDVSVIQQSLEPGGHGTDAAGKPYDDHNMWDLCGPGAATNTLQFWNGLIDAWGRSSYDDPSTGVTTTWTDEHNRSYILHLAWDIIVPGGVHAGMMDAFHDPSYGVTLYGLRDALNWEASGESAATWQTYFYVNEWWNNNTPDTLHADIVHDVAESGKPIIAEVNARLLPNWPSAGSQKNHFITIVGYDDGKHEYTYTDTCGHSTGCGSLSDAGIHTVAYSQLWQAITSIPVNTSTDPHAGDGGWVW